MRGDFCNCVAAITTLPDARRGAIQAMRFVRYEIVNESFVVNLLDY
jgi:hypothetical protein